MHADLLWRLYPLVPASNRPARKQVRPRWAALLAGAVVLSLCAGCRAPVSADRSPSSKVYAQIEGHAVSTGLPSQGTQSVLHRFDQEELFRESPDAVLQFIHQKAVESGEHDLLFVLSELNFVEGERLRHGGKSRGPWDHRDYYLAAAIYAWFFLFDGPEDALPGAFDVRFRAACAFYNFSLGQALTEPGGDPDVAMLRGGPRCLPAGGIELQVKQPGFPWPLTDYTRFAIADQFLVRGLTVRNRQPGLGTPLVAVARLNEQVKLTRATPATVVLRVEGRLEQLSGNQGRATLELYSASGRRAIAVGSRSVPLETDTTVPIAYVLNQPEIWKLGKRQFMSGAEQVPSDIYLARPYEAGLVPVVFVHGTFSSPVWWAEMVNTLSADPELGKRCQFWYFIYNSGNPVAFSATRLREALTAKIQQLDPGGNDPALQQMVVIGHSQGGLLTKMTATETGDKLWRAVNTNRVEDAGFTGEQQALIKRYLFLEPLPFVTRVVFISTPHRGSYLAGGLARKLARKLVTLPRHILDQSKELMGLKEQLGLPKMKGMPTSIDSMSPENPFMLALADVPTAPGVKAHSIIAVQGEGDYHQGKDGLVKYSSAHVDYTESEFIVRAHHSCQDKPATIEEVRRILRKHTEAPPSGPAGP